MPKFTIDVDKDMLRDLKKRADDNYFSVSELIEDIVRRSMLTYKRPKRTSFKVDDRLVGAFSRERRGRKRKKKK